MIHHPKKKPHWIPLTKAALEFGYEKFKGGLAIGLLSGIAIGMAVCMLGAL